MTDLEVMQERALKAEAEARRWQQYANALIDAAPAELRLHVRSRLDVTGRGSIEGGIWNYILDRTDAWSRFERTVDVGDEGRAEASASKGVSAAEIQCS